MQIDAHKRPMDEVLKTGQHIIPRYQRRYAWEEQNFRDYWSDLMSSNGPHFLGSMVVSGKSSSPKEVIDGQQRLTTTMIILSALRELYSELEAHMRVKGISAYLEYDDRDGDRKYRLTNKDDNANNSLKDNALLPLEHRPKSPSSRESSRESRAFELFTSLMRDEMGKGGDGVERLDRIRDAVIEAEVVYISVEERRNAFTIFETLNDRGQSLTVMDLVKNLLFSKIPEGAADNDERNWSNTLQILDDLSFEGMTPDYFLYYFWNSRSLSGDASSDSIEQSRIRRSISDYLEYANDSEASARSLVSDLSLAASTMDALDSTLISNGQPDAWRPLAGSWRRDKYEKISRILYGILVTGANQPFPTLLALMRVYHRSKQNISSQRLMEFLRTIENFQIRWTVAQKSSTSSIRRLYRQAASSIDAALTDVEFDKALNEFRVAAVKIDASDNQVRDGFTRLEYSKSRPRDLFKIRYVLTEIEKYVGGSKLDLSRQMSVEHLEGLAGKSEATRRNFWIFKIGNLTLLAPEVNASLPAEFSEKAEALKEWVNPSDKVLSEAIAVKSWSNEEYNRRQEQMLHLVLEIWPSMSAGAD